MLLLARTNIRPLSFERTQLDPKVLEDRIPGRRKLRLIRTWLRAGVTEKAMVEDGEGNSPGGGAASPP